MDCPLPIPPGTTLFHFGRSVRITFVEAVDRVVLRFVVEGTEDEFLIELEPGLRVRPTVRWVLESFAAGEISDCSAGEATLSEWRGRYLGLDRAAVMAAEPRAVLKYDIALAAIIAGRALSERPLHEFAKTFVSRPEDAPSGRTVIRAINNLRENDERIGAMRNRSGRERGRSQLPPIVDRLVHQAMALYHSREDMRKMAGHALVVHAWHRLKDAGVRDIGSAPPVKTTVVNRINRCENKNTWASKFGSHEADRHFLANGESTPVTRPFELVYIDGTEYRQVVLYSEGARIPSNKMKSVEAMDAACLFVFPNSPFAGPYRSEMGMAAILGVLAAPVLDEETLTEDPMRALFFGRIGRLRCDNDKAIVPPSAIANLAGVIRRVELAKKYGPNEKSPLEHFFGWKKKRLDGRPGTVLSASSRRRSIRRDPLAEASDTRASFAREHERLRLEWNAMGHEALGGRSPNDLMVEHLMRESKVRFTPRGEITRHLARTVTGVLTTDGVVFDGIRYRWNRTGITKLLSENLADQALAKRLEGGARCDVTLRVYDWNLDYVEVLNEHTNEFVTLWSDDPDYTAFLTRFEHQFHKSSAASGSTGAQTPEQKALLRAEKLHEAFRDMVAGPYGIAKKAAAVLECAEVRAQARNIADDPDLTDFTDLLLPTHPAGRDRVDAPFGPAQHRRARSAGADPEVKADAPPPAFDWGGLEPKPRTNQLMLEQDEEDDPDGGIDWEEDGAGQAAGEGDRA